MTRGRLELETLESQVGRRVDRDRDHGRFRICTGASIGKAHSRFFLSRGNRSRRECTPAITLLACDMEMDPTPGYAFTSWETGYGDMHAVPDLGTLRRAAWLDRTAVVLCDCFDEHSGEPISVAPRNILRRQVERAAAVGVEPFMASELEFYLFDDSYAEAREKAYRELALSEGYNEDYHVLAGTFAEPVIGAIRRGVDASGIPVEFSKGEASPGQHEINLRYASALEMADRHVLYKGAAKEIAAQQGRSITFMAKWHPEYCGNSMHVHMSLRDPGRNAAF